MKSEDSIDRIAEYWNKIKIDGGEYKEPLMNINVNDAEKNKKYDHGKGKQEMTKCLTIKCVQRHFIETKDILKVSRIKPDTTRLNTIRILYVHDNRVSFIDSKDRLRIESMHYLEFDTYASPYQPVRKYKVLWYYKNSINDLRISKRYYKNEEEFYNSPAHSERVLVQLIKDDFKDD